MDYSFFVNKLLTDTILLEKFLNCLLNRIDTEGIKFRNPKLAWTSNTGKIEDTSEITIEFEYIDDYNSVIQKYDLIYFFKVDGIFKYSPNSRNKEIINSIVASYLRDIRIDEILED